MFRPKTTVSGAALPPLYRRSTAASPRPPAAGPRDAERLAVAAGQPGPPGRLVLAGRHVVTVADQREPKQAHVGMNPRNEAASVCCDVGWAGVRGAAAIGIQECHPQPTHKLAERRGVDRLLAQVDKAHHDPSLAEESDRRARRL